MRQIAEPVVAAAPTGVRIRTRIQMTDTETAALTAIGAFLGSVYRGELAQRVRLGRMDNKAHAAWRTQRKRAVTEVSSSRWAGAMTRAVEDQYQLAMRGLTAHVTDLRAAVEVLERRCALRPGELAPLNEDAADPGGRSRRRRGYRSEMEQFAKTRRLAVLRERLAAAEDALAAGQPSITAGWKRLWRTRNHLDQAGISERQWRDRWNAARMFLTADGESGKAGGNETIRVDAAGQLRVKTPAALADQLGTHVTIEAPTRFSHRGDEWAARVAARRAVRYDIHYDPARGRWYLDASWTTSPGPAPDLDVLRARPVLGVDLNNGHIAACVLDNSGNPVGEPVTIDLITAGLPTTQRDGRMRAAITTLLDHAHQHNCSAVVIENLDFADARITGRELLGRGQRGKRLRRSIGGIPTRRFRDRLIAMATRRGMAVIVVDPAYTSKWGAQTQLPAEHHTTTARQFRPTHMHTKRRVGPPENTRRQRPTPFGPHRTPSCSVIRNG